MDKATQTLSEMIVQREYKIIEQDDDKIIGVDRKGKGIVAFLGLVQKFSIDRAKEFISVLHKMEIYHGIIVYNDCVTPQGKKVITNSVEIKLELFSLDELQYNITKHRLVPKHVRLKPKKAIAFKKKFGLKFPAILTHDPIARFYNYKRGDIIEIHRLGGEYITHRIVKG